MVYLICYDVVDNYRLDTPTAEARGILGSLRSQMGVVIGKWGITLAEANHATSHVYKTWALLPSL
ncbi:MAG: hypothetical protein BRC44_00090 [Cyanobacteria bacterium QS_4_48_99]|nr:MAG: hypothetical protein BRC44_00090 [Cyanobacteria bacterium QS_4_48_99]